MAECSAVNRKVVGSSPTCAVCGNDTNGNKYCSKKCNNIVTHAARKETRKCQRCEKEYSADKQTIRRLCRSCIATVDPRSTYGSKNPMWKGGHKYWKTGRFGRDKDGLSWKAQRNLAWERDNYTCQKCLRTRIELKRKPDVHHIKPYRISFSHALVNLISLCKKCHKIEDLKEEQTWSGFVLKTHRKLRPRCKRCSAKRRKLTEGTCSNCLFNEKKAEAAHMKKRGDSNSKIAKHFGVSRIAVWYWFNK